MLLIGYGNPGRGDDGVGPAFAERIGAHNLPGLQVRVDYQLTVDHALRISRTDVVIFVDALLESVRPYVFREVSPGTTSSLTTHSLSPQAVLGLCNTLYDHVPRAYIMGILGHEFGEVREGLSEPAKAGLAEAESFFLGWHFSFKPA